MPFRDLNEEQFIDLYKEILNYNPMETSSILKVTELKILFEIAKGLRDLNRRLQEGIYLENPEEQQERITSQVLAILKTQSLNSKPTEAKE